MPRGRARDEEGPEQEEQKCEFWSECRKCGKFIGPFRTAAEIASAPDVCEECRNGEGQDSE